MERDPSIRCLVVVPGGPIDSLVYELCPVGEVRMLAGTAAAEAAMDPFSHVFSRGGKRSEQPMAAGQTSLMPGGNTGPSLTLAAPEPDTTWEPEHQPRAQLWRGPGAARSTDVH